MQDTLTNIIVESKKKSEKHFKKYCKSRIESYQKQHLKKHERLPCPHCQTMSFYVKKGKRQRILHTSNGEVSFSIQQVQCCNCKKIFRPLNACLELKPRQHVTEELLEKSRSVAIHTSYGNASTITKEFTGVSLGKRTIRSSILEKSAKLKEEEEQAAPENYTVILKDSTKGKTGKTTRGEDITILLGLLGRVLTVNKKTGEITRTCLIGRILRVKVGNDSSICKGVQHKTNAVMTDGERGIDGDIQLLQDANSIRVYRCLWHLPRALGYALWKDGVSKEKRKKYIYKLNSIIQYSFNNYERYYDELIEECEQKGYKKAVGYLRRAKAGFIAHREHPILLDGVPLLANSPIERVMREVDRRADIGVRWKDEGLEAITRVRLDYLYNKAT